MLDNSYILSDIRDLRMMKSMEKDVGQSYILSDIMDLKMINSMVKVVRQ